MSNEDVLLEIVNILHKNDDTMLRNNLRKETGLEYVDFLRCISKLENQGYVRTGRGSRKKYHRYVYLTDKGIELAESEK